MRHFFSYFCSPSLTERGLLEADGGGGQVSSLYDTELRAERRTSFFLSRQ